MNLDAINLQTRFFCTRNFDKKKFRAIRENEENVFVYAPNKKRYGWRFSNDSFLEIYTPCITRTTDENAKWHKRIEKAITCLEKSGLWPKKLEFFKNLNKMTWDDHKELYRLYWDRHSSSDIDENIRLFQPWFDKYPFLGCIDQSGNLCIETSYLFEGSEVKLESMYFGKYQNDFWKGKIADAIKNKTKYNIPRVRTNYDISFEYDPERNMAWYSKEYKDCGNGYYYLALDEKTAWFIEKD